MCTTAARMITRVRLIVSATILFNSALSMAFLRMKDDRSNRRSIKGHQIIPSW